jgi:hypothetical protein
MSDKVIDFPGEYLIRAGLHVLVRDDDPEAGTRLLREGLGLAFAGLPELAAARLIKAIVEWLCWTSDATIQRNYDRIEAALRLLPEEGLPQEEKFGEAIGDLSFGLGFNPNIVVPPSGPSDVSRLPAPSSAA